MLQKIKSFFNGGKKDILRVEHGLARNGRSSVINPKETGSAFQRNKIIRHPAVTNKFYTDDVTIEKLEGLTDSQVISILLRRSSKLRFAVNLTIRYAVKSFQVVSDSPSAKKLAESFIEKMELRGGSFLALLQRFAYGIIVEGGFFGELVCSGPEDEQDPQKIVYISPFTAAHQKDHLPENGGEYYKTGQLKNRNSIDVLVDEAEPDPTLRYAPYLPQGDMPYGESTIQGSLFTISVLQDLMTTVSRFTKGQITPSEAIAPDISSLGSVYTADEITDILNGDPDNDRESFVDAIKAIQEGDESQIHSISVPIIRTALGLLESANLDAIPIIVETLERSENLGLNVPPVLMNSNRRGGMNDRAADTELISFNNTTVSISNFLMDNIDPLVNEAIRLLGATDKVSIKINGEDRAVRKIHYETFNIFIEGMRKVQEMNIFTPEVIQRKVIEESELFKDVEPGDLPKLDPQESQNDESEVDDDEE